MKYLASVLTQIGIEKGINQDNFWIDGKFRKLDTETLRLNCSVSNEKPHFIAVFDGMGGEKYGESASFTASKVVDEICKITAVNYEPDVIIRTINTGICCIMKEENCRSGTTCVFLEFRGDECRSWNVGDSRAYHYHENTLVRMSEDHTEEVLYAKMFNDYSVLGTVCSGRLIQYLGIPRSEFTLEPYYSPWRPVKAGDILLLCTDGLTNRVEDKEICKVVSSNMTLHEKREELLSLALGYGETDDITIVLTEAYEAG